MFIIVIIIQCHVGKKTYFAYIIANFIDGAALTVLPNDFTEFSHLVPQSGLRIKLKAAIERLMTRSLEQFSEVRQYLVHYSVVFVLYTILNK